MAEEYDDEETCTCVPEGAVVLRELCVVEYMMPDDTIQAINYSHNGAGEELDIAGTLYLAEWAKAQVLAPLHAMAIAELVGDDEDD